MKLLILIKIDKIMLKKKNVVIKCGAHLVDAWVQNMTKLLPSHAIYRWDDEYNSDDVEYVIGWCPDALWVNKFKNIKALVSIGSGVDHIENLVELRDDIEVIRTVSPDLIQRMREFVVMCVTSWHRKFPEILRNNEIKEWHRFAVDTSSSINVGIMGFGGMGSAAAEALKYMGYNVSVWAKTERKDTGYNYFSGSDSLDKFASINDILICMLPLTPETENILNKDLINKIRPQGCLINLGRGAHLVDDDLVEVMNTGHLSAAFLDGFRVEPLPNDSPLWDVRDIHITCHSAAYISPEAGPKVIAKNIKRHNEGEKIDNLYNRQLGY